MTIPRYTIGITYSEELESDLHPEGDWVKYEDIAKVLAAAAAMRDAAASYAGDCGLHSDAWLWDKIHEYEAALK